MKNKKEGKYSEESKKYLRYTGLAFQMAAVFAIAIFGGQFLDNRFELETPIYTLILTLVLFSGYMYKLYLELNKK